MVAGMHASAIGNPIWSSRSLIDWPVRVACLAYLLVFASVGDAISPAFSQAILILATLKCLLRGKARSLEFALTVGLFYLFVMPCIALAIYGYLQFVFIVAASVVLFDLLVALGDLSEATINQPKNSQPALTRSDLLLWWTLIAVMFAGRSIVPSGEGVLSQLSFNTPFAFSLVLFEKVCRVAPLRTIYGMIGVYMAAILFYAVFYWSGFGRIVIGSFALMPLLIAHHWRDIGLRIWPVTGLAPIAIYFGNALRHGEEATLTNLHMGSIGSHLTLTRQFFDNIALTAARGWDAFWDQWLLLFFAWVPRSLWPSKPIGLGREYVELTALRYYSSEGHSVATGYLGEVFFLLGSEAWLGGIIVMITLIAFRIFMRQAAGGYTAPVIAFDVFLISYVWGGMASFSSRMLFMAVPMLIFILFRRLRIRERPALRPGTAPR